MEKNGSSPLRDATPVFRPLLRTAWHITWRYPWLLAFGFFTSILGIGSFWELLAHLQRTGLAARTTLTTIHDVLTSGMPTRIALGFFQALRARPLPLATGFLVLLAAIGITVALLWLAAVSHGAIIDTVLKTTRSLRTTARAGWAVGKRAALRLLAVHLVMKITVTFLIFGIGLVITALAEWSNSLVAAFLFLLLLLAISLTATLLTMYAASTSVVRNFSSKESYRVAFGLFRAHWLISLELSMLFFLLSFVAGIAAFLLILLVTLPFAFFLMMIKTLALMQAMGMLMILWLLLVVVVLAVTAAYFSTWQVTAWTLLYLRLTEGAATPKLIRIFQKRKEAKKQTIT